MAQLDFAKYYEALQKLGTPQAKAAVEAIRKVENTGKTIAGLEDVERSSYFIPAIRPLRNSSGLGVYWGPGKAEDFGKRFQFIPLKVTRIKVIRNTDTKQIERRFFDSRVYIPQQEGRQILTITAILATTRDFKNLFAIEGLGTRTEKVANFLSDLKVSPPQEGIYELVGEIRRKQERKNGREFPSFDLELLTDEQLSQEELEVAKILFQFVTDYIEYRKSKSIAQQEEQEPQEETLPEPQEEQQGQQDIGNEDIQKLANLV